MTTDVLPPEKVKELIGIDFDESFFEARAWWVCKDPRENTRAHKLSVEHEEKQVEFCKQVCEELDCDYDKAIFMGRQSEYYMGGFVPNDPDNVNKNLKLPGPNDYSFDDGVYVLDGRKKLGRKYKHELKNIENMRLKTPFFIENIPHRVFIWTSHGCFSVEPHVYYSSNLHHRPVIITTWNPDDALKGSEEFIPDPEMWERRPLSEFVAYVEYCQANREKEQS